MDVEAILKRMVEAVQVNTTSSEIPSSTYKCERCHDSGWIDYRDEQGRSIVGKCACRLAREAEEKLQASGLADSIDRQTFDSFMTETETQRIIKATAQKYLADLMACWGEPRMPWLYIGGNPGSGKTHICTAVCGEILKRNIGVRYMRWLTDSRKIKYITDDDEYDSMITEFTGPSVLYIDDLFKQKYMDNPVFSEADVKAAFKILDARYTMNKPTIISSEWDLLGQLLAADEGTFSRVYERCRNYTVFIDRDAVNNYRLMGVQ